MTQEKIYESTVDSELPFDGDDSEWNEDTAITSPFVFGLCFLAVAVCTVVEGVLLFDAMQGFVWLSVAVWLMVHCALSVIGAYAITALSFQWYDGVRSSLFSFVLCTLLLVPFAGVAGTAGALLIGGYLAANRHQEEVYWQITRTTELPFTAPIGRDTAAAGRRSLVETVLYESDEDALYKKVLAAGNIRAALSVETLKAAVRHPVERIRLTAYQTLDRKVSRLNGEIQLLEKQANEQMGEEKSNTWLQIASNYWELLTLEKDEPIAREQLLKKASNAATQATLVMSTNRNAWFTLGRISLARGKAQQAEMAFIKALRLGMPAAKVSPFLAEAAFARRDFNQVYKIIKSINPAFRAYPPLSHLSEFWL